MLLTIKPLSVNEAWQGRRYKTSKYKKFERDTMLLIPMQKIPEGDLSIKLTFGFSNRASDIDNPTKMVLDILQKKLGFNDNRIYSLLVTKLIVDKGKEFIDYKIDSTLKK